MFEIREMSQAVMLRDVLSAHPFDKMKVSRALCGNEFKINEKLKAEILRDVFLVTLLNFKRRPRAFSTKNFVQTSQKLVNLRSSEKLIFF